MRVSELANELGKTSKEILEIIKQKDNAAALYAASNVTRDQETIQNKYQIACNSVDNGCLAYHSALELSLIHIFVGSLKTLNNDSYRLYSYKNGNHYLDKLHQIGRAHV